MKPDEFQRQLLALLAGNRNAPLSAGGIAAALKLKGKDRKQLPRHLHALVFRGDIARVRQNHYALPAAVDLVTGRLAVRRSGDGWVSDGAGREVFVRAEAQDTALPGDLVVARADPVPAGQRQGRPGGRVIRVLERARRDIVGTVRSTGRLLCVVPVDPAYSHDFYVTQPGRARPGDRVVLRFTGWQNRHVSPEGEIVEVLGPEDVPSTDTLAVLRQYGFPDRFPEPCLREAERVSARMEDAGAREDLRGVFAVTIDPARARDFDDALSLQRDAAGRTVLGVHIADVSHFVAPGGALDAEARLRGNSVYFPDRVIPMLPEQLSNGVCSLNPDQDRLAFSALMTLDDSGAVAEARFARSVIRSRQRLTYEQVQAVLEGRDTAGGEADGLIRSLDALAQKLRRRRFAKHALDLDVPECEFEVAADGSLAGVRLVRSDPSHQVVEECMVAANESVAAELARRRAPFISRLHDPPDQRRLEDLAQHLAELGIRHGDLARRENIAALLAAVRGDIIEPHVRVAVLRSMNRAVYSAERAGHFGLAKGQYTHFTSPIRRYSDLVVHRVLADALSRGSGRRYDRAGLAAVAADCSRAEQTAEEAERALEEMMKLRYLARELETGRPPAREAVVVDAVNFGLFVELPDLQTQGLVHVSAISDGYVRYSRRKRTLKAGSATFGIGRRVTVRVARVDMDKRQVDFVMA